MQYIQEYTEVFQEWQSNLRTCLSEGCSIKIKARYFGKEKADALANLSARLAKGYGKKQGVSRGYGPVDMCLLDKLRCR